MELILVRHGIAEPRVAEGEGAPEVPDAQRALTKDGRRRMRRIAKGLDDQGLRLDRLLHSPLLRAVESAEALAELVDGETEVTALLAAPPAAALLTALVGERVAVVGHEPWLGQLVAWLVVGDPSLGDRFPFKKGGVTALSGEARPGGMRLTAVWPPRTWRG